MHSFINSLRRTTKRGFKSKRVYKVEFSEHNDSCTGFSTLLHKKRAVIERKVLIQIIKDARKHPLLESIRRLQLWIPKHEKIIIGWSVHAHRKRNKFLLIRAFSSSFIWPHSWSGASVGSVRPTVGLNPRLRASSGNCQRSHRPGWASARFWRRTCCVNTGLFGGRKRGNRCSLGLCARLEIHPDAREMSGLLLFALRWLPGRRGSLWGLTCLRRCRREILRGLSCESCLYSGKNRF